MAEKVEVRVYIDHEDALVIDAITLATGESRGAVINRFLKKGVDFAVHQSTLISNVLKGKGSQTAAIAERQTSLFVKD